MDAETIAGTETFTFQVTTPEEGVRLDVFLHNRVPDHSRSYLKEAVKLDQVTVDGKGVKPSHRVSVGECVVAKLEPRAALSELVPQDIPIKVIHEDASVLVLDKQPQLVVHPGNGRRDGTLANGLAYHIRDLSDVGGGLRPGIVHRLDRDTTGVMVVAKTNRAHFSLATQFQERTTTKEYLALVEGEPDLDGDIISHPLGRSLKDPSKIVVDEGRGRPAETRYEVLERFRGFALVKCLPKTGRTHQIRVHLKSIGHPVVCDPVYGRRARLRPSDIGVDAERPGEDAVVIGRQALHAHSLGFFHPLEGRAVRYSAPLHEDMEEVLDLLRKHRGKPAGRRS